MKKSKIVITSLIVILIFINRGDLAISLDNNKHSCKLNSELVLVNRNNALEKQCEPINMVKLNINFVDDANEEEKYMDEVAALAITELYEEAQKDGINLLATSAYRSYEKQQKTYMKNVIIRGKQEANKYVALPGKSEHQTGLAIDFTNEERWFDKSTKEAKWLDENAHRFGFILRYPEGKEDITDYNFEPWHIRYVGKDVSKIIYNKNITLEEYLENNKGI